MRIGIIGTGIIASAIVTGFCTKNTGHGFYLSPRNAQRAAALYAKFAEVSVCASNQEVVDNADLILICLLKKDFGALGELEFRKSLKVINVSADMRLSDLRNIIGETELLAHVIPLPFISSGYGPLLVYPRIEEVGELFAPVSDVYYADRQENVHTFQIATGLMSAYYMLLGEIVGFIDEQGIKHDESVDFLCSLFGSLCTRAANAPNGDLVKLAHEMTPGGYNEQAMKELLGNGAIAAWRTALDRLLARMQENRKG